MIADTNDVYVCCDFFISFRYDTLLIKVHPEFVLAIEAAVIVDNDLDCFRCTDNSSHFYNICYSIIVEKQIPKFESANYINVLLCQKYLEVLSDLTLVEEAFITYAYSVMSVIKLKPCQTGSTACYHRI